MVIPSELADAMTLTGPKERIKDRLQAWRDSKVSTLLIATTDKDVLRTVAEVV